MADMQPVTSSRGSRLTSQISTTNKVEGRSTVTWRTVLSRSSGAGENTSGNPSKWHRAIKCSRILSKCNTQPSVEVVNTVEYVKVVSMRNEDKYKIHNWCFMPVLFISSSFQRRGVFYWKQCFWAFGQVSAALLDGTGNLAGPYA